MAEKKAIKKKKTLEEIGVEIIKSMDEEFRHESDRVVAIVGAAYLESLFEHLFQALFIDDAEEMDRLLRADAPLGSFGARCQLAYCLGLIAKDQLDDLRIIGKIRNSFAHNFNSLTFNGPPVRDLCVNLKQPGAIGRTTTPRKKYETTVMQLFSSLLRRANLVSRLEFGGYT